MEPKMRKVSVKLRTLAFVNTTPEAIQDLILDNRIKSCRVNLQRTYLRSPVYQQLGAGQSSLRRCCVRIPRLDYMSRSEISTPTASIAPSESFESLEQL